MSQSRCGSCGNCNRFWRVLRCRSRNQRNCPDGDNQHSGRVLRKKGDSVVLEWIARVFSRRPFLVLFLTLSVAVILSKFGISEFGFPELEDPYLGFETRFTPIANRLIALENLRKEVSKLGLLENYPGERLSGREFRRRRETYDDGDFDVIEDVSEDDNEEMLGGGYCTKIPLDDYSRVALEIKVPKDIFSHETLMLVCYFQKLTEVLVEYGRVCEHDDNENCCPMWSLPNYVTQYTNKTDCSYVKEYDIHLFKEGMNFCRELYLNPTNFEACTLKHDACPQKCHRDEAIYSAMFLTVDKGYGTDEDVKFTMIILPIPKHRGSRSRTAMLQTALADIKLPEAGVYLAGYDFGDKDWIFKRHLVSDLQYVMIGSIVIFFIVMIYTKSLSVTTISFFVLVLSLGLSYFLYTAVFLIPYFPFMNMLVTIIVMGIGTDATLILGSEWQRLKSKNKDPDQKTWDAMMVSLLKETTAPLVVTTCTTAGAFFASLTSSITTIRCFSIFAGTSILVGFVLLYLCVPTTLLLSDICISYLTNLFSDTSDSSTITPTSQNGKISSKLVKIIVSLKSLSSIQFPENVKKSFQRQSFLLWTISFLTLLSILVWSCLIVFHSPGFQLPNSEQFQLLSSDHPIERFDREIEPRFPGSLSTSGDPMGDKLTLYLIWGVLPVDNGFGLDPHDNGMLKFDPNFSLEGPKNQKWMRKLCSKLRKQNFYDEVSNTVVGAHYDSCFMDTMVKWMKRDCQHVFTRTESYKPCCKVSKFPYKPEVFTKCVEESARDLYRTPSLYFQPDIAGPKFHTLKEKQENSTDSDKSGQLATFALRIRTNLSFSLSYEKMRDFYQDLDNFFLNEVYTTHKKTPAGLENGFFISAHLDFFDLQNSLLNDTWMSVFISAGLCFGFLWLFSHNFLIALGAVLCIFSIVIVSSAVLIYAFGWKLGVFESIAVTVAVGLSDFTAHHALEYSRRKSVMKMTSPTFFSAITTITIGLSMLLFSKVLVYQQIGAFFSVLITVSWLYSVFFLSPILDIFDRFRDLITSICRLYSFDSFGGGGGVHLSNGQPTIVEDNSSDNNVVNALVFSNPMASDNSTRSSFNELDVDCEHPGRSILSKSQANILNEDQSAIIEKVKLLKKVAAETSV